MDEIQEKSLSLLNNIVQLESFKSLSSFLEPIDLQDSDLELNQNENEQLQKLIDDFKEQVYKIQLDDSNQVANLMHTLFAAYTLRTNQIEIMNEHLTNENDELRNETENREEGSQKQTIDDLKSQINELKLALNNAETQNEIYRDEAKNEIVFQIANEFGLTSKDIEHLISDFHSMVDEQMGIVKNIIHTFDLPQQTTQKDIIYQLEQKFKEAGNSGIAGMLREELLKKTEEIEDLKEQIAQLKKSDNQEKQQKKKDSKQQKSESDEFKLDDDSDLFESPKPSQQPPEVSEYNRNKISNLEKQIEELKEKLNASPNEKEILAAFEEIPLGTNEISSIIQADMPLINKVKQMLSVLSLKIFSGDELQGANKMLLSCVSAQFRFIKSLADSEKACTAVYAEEPYEVMRNILQSQAAGISLFLQEHASGIVEDSCLFEELLKRDSPDLLEHVQQYLQAYAKPSSKESEELFILLLQAINAADVLRKYSSQSQMLCHQQASDIKQMKSYNEQLEKSLDTLNTSGNPSSNTNNRSLITESQGQNNDANTGGEPLSSNEYIRNLQKQLQQVRSDNFELKKEKENLVKQTHDDFLKVQEMIDNMKDSMNKRLQQKNRDMQKLSIALKDSTNRYKELREKYNKLKENQANKNNSISKSNTKPENSPVKKQNSKPISPNKSEKKNSEKSSQVYSKSDDSNSQKSNDEDNSKSILNDIQSQFEETKKEYEQTINQMREEVEEYQNKKQKEFNEAVTSKDKIIQELTNKLNESNNNNKKLTKQSEKLNQQLEAANNQISELTRSENEALGQAESLGNKFREIHDDYTNLEHENELLKQKLESYNDISKRDKQLIETQYEHKLNDQKIKYQNMINKVKEDSAANSKKFLLDIAHSFPSFVDLNQPVTRESILDALQNVKKACESEVKLKKKRDILAQARKDLKVERDIQVPGAIITLLNKYEKLECEAKPLADGMEVYMQMQDWLSRMYVLCTNGVCQDVSNVEMQHVIEEVLVHAFGSLLLSRRISMLRAEKKLIIHGALNVEKKNQRMSVRHLLIMIMLVLKARKLSGHHDGTGYSFENAEKPEDIMNPRSKRSLTFAEKAPLSNFLYDLD